MFPFNEDCSELPREMLEFYEVDEDEYEYYDVDPDTGKHGYWTNPKAKWDWYSVGGRASGFFRDLSGNKCDELKVKDFNFGVDEKEYKKALRFWELIVEGKPLIPGEEMPFTSWRKEYFIDRYSTKEYYADYIARPIPWAFLTQDGDWVEQGKMGWWGLNDSTHSKVDAMKQAFYKCVQESDPEDTIVIVDCHI